MKFTDFINTLRLEVRPWEHEPETSARMDVYNRDGDLLIADAVIDRDNIPDSDTWNTLSDCKVLDIYVSSDSEMRENVTDRRKSPVEHYFSRVSVRLDMEGVLI